MYNLERMKNLKLILGLAVLLGMLTSCGDFQHELTIQPNGSGKLETSFDMGEMMSMIGGFQDMVPNEDTVFTMPEDKELNTEEAKDPFEAMIKKVTDPAYPHDFDTLISFESIAPDSIKKEVKDFKKHAPFLKIRMKSPANSGNLVIGLVTEFKDQKHLTELNSFLGTLDESSNSFIPNAGAGTFQSESFMSYTADLKAGWITIDSMDYSNAALEMSMSPDGSKEDAGMMEMLFGQSKIKMVIHVPGEVQSCTYSSAVLTKDNKVIVEMPLMGVLKKGFTPSFTIRFTPKK